MQLIHGMAGACQGLQNFDPYSKKMRVLSVGDSTSRTNLRIARCANTTTKNVVIILNDTFPRQNEMQDTWNGHERQTLIITTKC